MTWTKRGSGCDKAFYWDGEDSDGWLNFSSKSVLTAELASRGKLGNVSEVIPEIDQARSAPELEDVEEPLGYYVRRVNLGLTIKPQMNVFQVLQKVKSELKAVAGDEKIAALKSSMEYMLENCELICSEVGEFTFGIDQDTGKAYLLDLARNSSGQAGGHDQAQSARRGFTNMLKLLE